ncbi:type VII secretion protein EccB [Actinokineospora sp. G85]|uniref:type VII secretion protein EccB n=1 Tax=Actinokineospora sp. G85 TaxID=3406626 RepID=UPI003C7365AE
MASKRDQLHAHQFMLQRVVSALVTRESDPEQPPFRRPGTAAFGGIALAVIALAAVGVYGIINPGGNDSWRDGESVVVEEETGTRFVYLDGRLHPVANYTSALLALDRSAPTSTVSRDSLVGVPRGPRIGIPDAPDALPGRDRLLGGGWTLCSQPTEDAAGAVAPSSVLMVGQSARAGDPLGDRAVLVDVPETGERYLVLRGHRHRVAEPDRAAVGLALRAAPPIRVSPAVVEAVPMGLPIGPLPVAQAGQPSGAVPSRPDVRAGQLLAVPTSRGVQHYLAEVGHLRPITELQLDIQLGHQGTAAAYPGAEPEPVPLGITAASGSTQLPAVAPQEGDPPRSRPEFAQSADPATLCLTYDPGSHVPRVTMAPEMPPVDPMSATPRRTGDGATLADRVVVPPGWAAVVAAAPSGDAQAGTLVVVTDLGVAHPLGDPGVLEVLGYGGVEPVRMPAGLVARVPMGSGLDHAAALRR